jgi:hypothetical protein
MSSRVIHFEIPADDPSRAERFYSRTFGWTFTKWDGPNDYWLVGTGENGPGIDGGMAKRQNPQHSLSNTIGVESVDRALEAVTANGGTVLSGKAAIPGVGWLAYFADPEGNPMGLMQADPAAR